MKRFEVIILMLFLLPGPAAAGRDSRSFVLTRDGQPQCHILARQEAGEQARELQHWLGRVTGAKIPIESAEKRGRAVVLGTAKEFPQPAAKEKLAELGPEGYVIRSDGDRLWVLANSNLGLQHAVYALLEQVGCRWFFPDPVWTVVPRAKNLAVEVRLREKPAFAYRRIWYGWGARTPKLRKDYVAWQKHNRQLGHFQANGGHAYARYVPGSLLKEHPEWFALVGGKRKATQLCTSNPEVQRKIIDGVLSVFRKDPNRNMVSVDPNDGGGYCECKRCKAIGSVSDRVFLLAGNVATAVRKEFPDKWVGLYAYAHHCEPPRRKFAPGVYVQVTTGFRYTKLSFDEQVAAFGKLGARLGVYDYFSVYAWDHDMPGAAKAGRFHRLAKDIRRYRDLGLSTYSAESSCNWGPNGPGYWMAARLMWNPDLDTKELTADFCTRAFGKAAKPMQRLYERWATGQRFSPRGLKLALLDLNSAYQQEKDPAVRRRLDRVAMYLHHLRLWSDYDRSARWNQWSKLVAASPKEIQQRAQDVIVHSRRLMDTGLIHTHPMLFTTRFKQRFSALTKMKDFDIKQAEAWKQKRTDIPSAGEIAESFADDLKRFEKLTAVELKGREFDGKLVPLTERLPKAVKAWGDVRRSPLCVESGTHYFIGAKGRPLRLSFTPFDRNHTVDGHWVLRRPGGKGAVAEGDVKAPKGKVAELRTSLPSDGVFALDPGTGYWKTAELGFDARPLSVWAGRADQPGRPKRKPLRLWRPRLAQPLYFFVPKGTRHFVICIAGGGDPFTTLVLRTADGNVVLENKRVLAGDQISVIVPPGRDGAVWSLDLSSLRCVVELYDIPPYLARHPAELLVPEATAGK